LEIAMNADSPCSSAPAWPCTVESSRSGQVVRDGNDVVTSLPAFQDACRDRAVVLRREAQDAAVRNAWAWLRRSLRQRTYWFTNSAPRPTST
jgi:hypothetical protein